MLAAPLQCEYVPLNYSDKSRGKWRILHGCAMQAAVDCGRGSVGPSTTAVV